MTIEQVCQSTMEDDDDIQLSSASLAALQDFLKEQSQREAKMMAITTAQSNHIDMDDFGEDWQLSQFWYSVKTRDTLAQEMIKATEKNARVGCLSSPSVYVHLKKTNNYGDRKLFVFEYDRRFNVYGQEYIFYDYNAPFTFEIQDPSIPLQAAFDYLIIDPPFLSQECWSKVSQTAKFLLKPGGKILVCTGKVVGGLVSKELNCRETVFRPEHTNGLQNEFRCYTNYKPLTFEYL